MMKALDQWSMKIYTITLIALLLFPLLTTGQPKIVHKHYSTNDGLPDNRIRKIIKDKDGFMWLASWSGLSRFDGNNFVNFKSYPGDSSDLKSNRIIDIVEVTDSPDYLWIMTYEYYIYRFDKTTNKFTKLSKIVRNNHFENFRFSRILEAKNNEIWVKASNDIVYHFSDILSDKPAFNLYQKKSNYDPEKKYGFFETDKKGNKWIAFSESLQKINKSKAENIQIAEKLNCTDFAEHENGSIWISTLQGYILEYTNNVFKKHKISDAGINNLRLSRDGKIYATSNNGELITISENGEKMAGIKITNAPLYTIYEDKNGIIWIEPDLFGVFKYNPKTNKVNLLTQENTTNYLHGWVDYKVYEDNTGLLWVYMKGCGFGYYDTTSERIEYFYNNPNDDNKKFSNSVTDMYYDDAGILWLSTDQRGLEKNVFQTNDFQQHLIVPKSKYALDNDIRSIIRDKLNRIWVSAKSGKINVYDNNTLLSDVFINKPYSESGIYSILEDKNRMIWLGSKNNGLFVAEPIDNTLKKYKTTHYLPAKDKTGFNAISIFALFEDSKGRIWAGSFGDGLILIEKQADNSITFKTVHNYFTNYSNSFNKIRHIAEDRKGNIWLATTNGLVIFNPDEMKKNATKFYHQKKRLGDPTSIGGEDILYLYKDRLNNMWVCTSSGGLNLAKNKNIDLSDKIPFQNFSAKNGLPGENVLKCVEDEKGFLWVVTQNSVSKLNSQIEKFQNFDLNHGLNDITFSENAITTFDNGNIAVGSNNGFWTFNPNTIDAKRTDAKLAITGITVNNESIGNANNISKLVLEYNKDNIRIDFALLDYRFNEKEDYLYRLVGADDNWQVGLGQRNVTYSNLPSGKYIFEVKSQSDYLYTQQPIKTLSITILPPPWKTWWAYIIYASFVITAIFIAWKVTFKILRLRQGIAVEKKLANLKTEFFTQVSHELRTPLTLILNPAKEIEKNESLTTNGKSQVEMLISNAERMTQFVNQLLDLSKVQAGASTLRLQPLEITEFLQHQISFFKVSANARNINIILESDIQTLWAFLDRDKMDIIFYNLISNAIKYSYNNSNIIIRVNAVSDKAFNVQVIDEGVGVNDPELADIFKLYYEGARKTDQTSKGTGIGLALTKGLVDLHKGSINATHNQPNGLIINLVFPIGDISQLTSEKKVSEHEPFTLPLEETEIVAKNELPLVLVVEDNDDLRKFLDQTLSKQFKILTAANGEEGLEMALEHSPDLILSDIMMPKMNGIEMLDKLKNDVLTSHIPVVLLTAKASVESQIEALTYGADYYISKPFSTELLFRAIHNLIAGRKRLLKNLLTKEQPSSQPEEAIVEIEETIIEAPQLTAYDKNFLEEVARIIEEKIADSQFNIDDVAATIGMSRSTFFRKFKGISQLAPVEFVKEIRLKKAIHLFNEGEDNISSVAYEVGFSNPKYFSTCFKAQYSITPTEYLKQLKAKNK